MRAIAVEVMTSAFVVGMLSLYAIGLAWLTILPSIGALWLLGWLK
jgi:hypothetical protein